ncbi:Yip1 family protein [Candidatus Desulforudis audaxviator]|uniref:Yip1 family protein n=1 Tax=Candidatus Desulforudis audaxviator TaxID=471827 RepID=UPI0006746D01|nr:Yip1 family protein [Candidatus Desulforudis audaxviator]
MGSLGFLEIIYGVLFDPVKTFRRLAEDPPFLLVLVIVTLVNAAGTLMSMLTVNTIAPAELGAEFDRLIAGVAPFLVLAGFFLWYAKWLGYGAVLHLVAQLLGGRNGPKATLTVYGLAGLPAVFMLPVQGFVVVAGLAETPASAILGLIGLGVFVWSLALLIIGLREVHQLSTGGAAIVVFAPVAAVAALFLLLLIVLVVGFAPVVPSPSGFPLGL